MLTLFRFTNLASATLDLNTVTTPMRTFEVSGSTRVVRRTRMQEHGEWPAPTYFDGLSLHTEGDILAATSDAYIAARQTMLATILGDLTVPPTSGVKLGTLTIQMDGWSAAGTVDCSLDAYPELPIRALYPGTTPYLFNWILWRPYLLTGGGATLYL